MKKRFALILCALVLCLGLSSCGGAKAEKEEKSSAVASTEAAKETVKAEEKTSSLEAKEEAGAEIKVASLKGPTTIGLLHLMEKTEKEKLPYRFQMEATPDALLPEFVSGKVDIAAVPANMAAVLYQKLDKDVLVLNINTLGVLYGISGNAEVKGFQDIAGKTVYSTGQGASPEYLLNALLQANNLSADISFFTEPAEIAAKLKENPNAVAILPEPFATATLVQNTALERKFSLTEEWNKFYSGTDLPTAVTVVRKSFYDAHKEEVRAFLEEEKKSIEEVAKDPEETARLCVEKGIMQKEELAKKAIPSCNVAFVDGEAMKKDLQKYFEVLFEANPKSVGGALPGDDFYSSL